MSVESQIDEAVAASLPLMQRLTVPAGSQVFAQGDVGDAAYIVNKGRVRLYQHLDGQRVELGDVEPGQIFGEMAVIDGGSRSASATAIEDSSLSKVPQSVFLRKLDKSDRFLAALIDLFIRNIRNSPRLFLRRPRSFRDHVKQMRMFSWNMRRFAGRMGDTALADDVLDALERLDATLADLHHIAELTGDKRHDLISDDELNGVAFSSVVGTDGQRQR